MRRLAHSRKVSMAQAIGSLTVNLSAVGENWLMMRQALKTGAVCGAVVKANAYGLGVARVAQALYAAGCRHFFVAHVTEGVELRRMVPNAVPIYVLQGAQAGEELLCKEYGLTPVLVSTAMFARWRRFSANLPAPPPCALKVNTGMNRLGMALNEFLDLASSGENFSGLNLTLLMSHLACADDPEHPLNERQLQRFNQALEVLRGWYPKVKASLANSAGVFLGAPWQQDLARPGIALYGGRPRLDKTVIPQPVVGVTARVIQTRVLEAGETVGYGAEYTAPNNRQVAVVSSGYAEGLMRSLNGCYKAWFGAHIPLLGRVSMDSLVFDITDLPRAHWPQEGDEVELIGPHVTLDEFAECAGTSTYEVLTRLGGRLNKRYLEPGS